MNGSIRGAGLALSVTATLFAASPAFAQKQPLPAFDAGQSWSVRQPASEKVIFRGLANHHAAGVGNSSMLYPAPNIAGFVAAIVTHGLLNESAKSAQKQQIQNDADAVLKPYEPVLQHFTNDGLIRNALTRLKNAGTPRLLAPGETASEDWLIETTPVFSMTLDQRALVLDNAVRFYAPGETTATYAQTIRVVSHAVEAPVDAGGSASWLADDGQGLTDESALLLAESLKMAIEDATTASPETLPQKTFRYPEGGAERMERAHLVKENCGRLIVRTLRGGLLSIPVSRERPTEDCPGT